MREALCLKGDTSSGAMQAVRTRCYLKDAALLAEVAHGIEANICVAVIQNWGGSRLQCLRDPWGTTL